MEDRKKQGYFQTSLIRWLAAEGCSGSGIYPSGITEKQNGNKEGITKCRTPCLRAGSVSEISYLDFLNINMSTNNGLGKPLPAVTNIWIWICCGLQQPAT